jgi:hypothetical protein
MGRSSLKRATSGQVLVITCLMVAILLLSTAIYVVETEKDVPIVGTADNESFALYKQSVRSSLISALANVTNGGDASVLTADLSELSSAFTSHSYQAILQMNYSPLNSAPYQNGFWISWGVDGKAISSAYVNFVFNSSGFSTVSSMQYAVNVTSQAYLGGNYAQLGDNQTQVNLTVNVFNEGNPALAQNFGFYIEDVTGWVKVDSPTITDFGDGAYAVSFIIPVNQTGNPLPVSMFCQDLRGITLGANVTCNAVG